MLRAILLLSALVASAAAVCTNSSKFNDETGELCKVPINYLHPSLLTEGGDLVLKYVRQQVTAQRPREQLHLNTEVTA